MPWSITDRTLTHSGTSRDFWYTARPMPGLCRITAICISTSHRIGIMVHSTPDGRTGFQCGIDPSDSQRLSIRRVRHGVVETELVGTAHGFPDDAQFSLVVEVREGQIQARMEASGHATAMVNYVNSIEPTFSRFTGWGPVSSVDDAVVVELSMAELRAVQSELMDVLVVVAGGSIYAAYDESSIVLLERGGFGAFSRTGQVSLAVLDGIVYGVDGARALKIDILRRRVIPWGPDDTGGAWNLETTGTLPGAREIAGFPLQRYPGTTNARYICAHRGRIYLAGMSDSPHAIWASAVRDPQMWNFSEAEDGRAFAVGVERRAGVGGTITGIASVANNMLIIGMARSVAVMFGDPIDGLPRIIDVLPDFGLSGHNAIAVTSEGSALLHSPNGGLVSVDVNGGSSMLSLPVLSEHISFQVTERERKIVTLVRDTQRHGTCIFITPDDPAISGVHLWYDERIGRFVPGEGGFFPEEYPVHIGPTAATFWRGKVILGSRDGKLWRYENPEEHLASDDGEPIRAFCAMGLMNDDSITGDTIMTYFRAELSDDSDPLTLSFYGGVTAESAYSHDSRELLLKKTIGHASPPVVSRIRSRAIVAELSSELAGAEWRLEAVNVTTQIAPLLRRASKHVPVEIHGKCEPFEILGPPLDPPGVGYGPGQATSLIVQHEFMNQSLVSKKSGIRAPSRQYGFMYGGAEQVNVNRPHSAATSSFSSE